MKILITGVAGFIGTNLCEYLLKNGHSVIGIDNFTLGRRENIVKFSKDKNFKFYEISITSSGFVNELSNKLKNETIDEVWHLAASSDILKGVINPFYDHRDTFKTTWQIAEFCKVNKIHKIIFSSTGAVYGNHKGRYYEDKTVPRPISSYGTFKLASENLLRTFQNDFLETVVVFRFSNVLGPYSTHGVILDFIKKIKKNGSLQVLGNGFQQKPYIHVSELILGMDVISKKINNKFEIFNLGPEDTGVKVRDIANLVVKKFDFPVQINYESSSVGWVGDIPTYKISNSKAEKIGFKPKLTSKEVVSRAINEIFKENLKR